MTPATERVECVVCGGMMRVSPESDIERCLPCRRDGETI